MRTPGGTWPGSLTSISFSIGGSTPSIRTCARWTPLVQRAGNPPGSSDSSVSQGNATSRMTVGLCNARHTAAGSQSSMSFRRTLMDSRYRRLGALGSGLHRGSSRFLARMRSLESRHARRTVVAPLAHRLRCCRGRPNPRHPRFPTPGHAAGARGSGVDTRDRDPGPGDARAR